MSVTITVKKGDTARVITDTLTLDGTAIDLTDATVLLIWKFNGTVSRTRTATIVDAAAGEISYQLLEADVDTAGVVEFEWEITFGDDTVLTVPTDGVLTLGIVEDLG